MKLKYLLSIFTAIAFALSTLPVLVSAADESDVLTSKILKESILSETIKIDVSKNDFLKPQMSGKITFSKPFQIPYYSVNKKKTATVQGIWCSAMYSNEELKALAMLSYSNNQVVLGSILYVPYDFKECIANGEELSLFFVDAETDTREDIGTLMYSIDKKGNSKLLLHELYGKYDIQNSLSLNTSKRDYNLISKHNSISMEMSKAVTTEYIQDEQMTDNTVILIDNVESGGWDYKGSVRFIVHKCGVDENGEAIYSLSPQKTPSKYIKCAGSKKLYIRCAFGGTKPIYKICSALNSDKVIALPDNNARVQNWSEAETQQWYIHILADK